VILATREADQVQQDDLSSTASAVVDWSAVVDLAISNGVTAYVRRALATIADPVPADAV